MGRWKNYEKDLPSAWGSLPATVLIISIMWETTIPIHMICRNGFSSMIEKEGPAPESHDHAISFNLNHTFRGMAVGRSVSHNHGDTTVCNSWIPPQYKNPENVGEIRSLVDDELRLWGIRPGKFDRQRFFAGK